MIQIVMGWTGGHLYEFECGDRCYGESNPFDIFGDDGTAQAAKTKLKAILQRLAGGKFYYVYDFGDSWEHRVIVKRSGLGNSDPCPRLLDGAMACPPEDIGGPPGYDALKAALDGHADEHGDMLLEAIGSDFDPAAFDKDATAAALGRIQSGFGRR